jgi:zinc and cadmium transporter
MKNAAGSDTVSLWLYALGSAFAVSLVSLVGALTFLLAREKLGKALLYLVSFSAGGLFSDAFIHLIPEAFESNIHIMNASLMILFGIIVSFIIERFVKWRHCHIPTSESHPHTLGYMNLFGDSVHNFVDGLLIGGSFLESPQLGLSTSMAILFHEVPQEIGDLGVLVYSGFHRGKALLLNLLTAFVAILGTTVALVLGASFQGFARYLVPFAAGNFVYIAGSDLIPELQRDEFNLKRSALQLSTFILGILAIFLLAFLE